MQFYRRASRSCFWLFPLFPSLSSRNRHANLCALPHVCKTRVVGFCRPWSSSLWLFVTAQRLSCWASLESSTAHGAVRQAETKTQWPWLGPVCVCVCVMRNRFQSWKQELPLFNEEFLVVGVFWEISSHFSNIVLYLPENLAKWNKHTFTVCEHVY